MQLLLLDRDINYIRQLEQILCIMEGGGHSLEIVLAENIENIERISEEGYLSKERGILVFHEAFIPEIFHEENKHIEPFLKRNQWAILSEGMWDENNTHIIQDYYIEKHNETHQENKGDTGTYIINKYQTGADIYAQLRERFIHCIHQEITFQVRKTSFMTLYYPYGAYSFSEDLLSKVHSLTRTQKNKKILIVHYDSFYHKEEKAKNHLSYLYMQIRQKKCNFQFILNEIAQKQGQNIQLLEGVMHMEDHEFLTEKEEKRWLSWLREKSGYDLVVFSLNGVHISKGFRRLLQMSDKNILFSAHEIVQRRVLEQMDVKWQIAENKNEDIIALSATKLLQREGGESS